MMCDGAPTGEVGLRKAQAFAQQPVDDGRAQGRPEGHESQRVGELAVKLEIEQRIRLGADQHIEIGCQSADETRDGKSSDFLAACHALCECRAEGALGDGIQGVCCSCGYP